MEAIDIVMTTWHRETITLLSLANLIKQTDYPHRLIILDNGSDRYAQAIYGGSADVYHRFDENVGLEAAKNFGMKFVQSEWFISTDNDILVPKRNENGADWLLRLVLLKTEHPEYAAIALRPQVLVGTGDLFGDNPPKVKEFSHVPGYMRIMETDLVRKLGAWDDKRPLRGHEEYWISEKIIAVGRKVGWASYIPCYHLFGDNNWGYEGLTAEETGHNPTQLPQDNWEIIKKDFL